MFDLPEKATDRAGKNWKPSQAFINASLPAATPSGARKIGTMYIQVDKKGHQELLDFLKADPNNINVLKDMLILDFQLAEDDSATDTGFILPGMEASS